MIKKRYLVALGAFSAALAACSSEVSGPGMGMGAQTNGGSTGSPGGGANSGANGGVVTTPNAGSTSAQGGNGSGAANSGSSGSPSSSTGGSSSGTIPLPPEGPCMPGIPATTQIPRMQNRQYENVVRDLLGVTQLDGKPVSEALIGDFEGAMTAPAWTQYQKAAVAIAAQVMSGPNKSMFISCDPAATDCLKTTVETFGRKAFRRKLTSEEVESFLSLNKVTPAGTPAQVAEAILEAFLVSPSFILLPELNVEAEGSAIKLSQQEVATRLSFLLWGSVPDAELNAAADAGQLQTKADILKQAVRMIEDRKKTGALISAFHEEWSQVNNGSGHWYKIDHDPAKYPTYNAMAKTTYQKEMSAFFEEVAYTGGSFKDLLLSNVAFVNKDNAAIYGLDPAQYGTELTKVTLDPAKTPPRPGFLTRAGFLSSYANYDATSPILRGAFISVWLLNINPGAPDPNAVKATVQGNFPTQRAYIEALTEKAQPCQGCHTFINPPGYVLENYDGMGSWQTKDLRGGAIDASVTTATVQLGDGITKQISSPTELMQEIANSPRAQSLYARAWVSYAFGRSPNANDQCVVDVLKMKLAGSTYSIRELLGDLTQADSFRLRVRATP